MLKGARHVTLGGYYAYVTTDAGIVIGEFGHPAAAEDREGWKESRVLQNEYLIWSRRDKHARAYGCCWVRPPRRSHASSA